MSRKLKFLVVKLPCNACGGGHTDWWKSTPAPSCAERQRRRRAA